jgi:thymidylate synthase (FAD)
MPEYVDIQAEFKTATQDVLKYIEEAGRSCYLSNDKISEKSYEKFIGKLLSHDPPHESVIEHGSVMYKIICDRGIQQELKRHRIASYSIESTRYVGYDNGKFGSCITLIKTSNGLTEEQLSRRHKLFTDIENLYMMERSEGVAPEIARDVLPLCLKSVIYMTVNFRELRHIFKIRLSKRAHPYFRKLAKIIYNDFKSRFPVIVKDINNLE